MYPLFEKSPANGKHVTRDCAKTSKLPFDWREAGWRQTLSLRASEAVRSALDLLDTHEHSLRAEGLWRESGNAIVVAQLAAKMLDGTGPRRAVLERIESGNAHDVVGAIKHVLKQHQPLTTYSRCNAFVVAARKASNRPSGNVKVDANLTKLFTELPAINRQILGRLALHFDRLIERADYNRMSWRALGIALAPTLLRRDDLNIAHVANDPEAIRRVKNDATAFAEAAEHILRAISPAKRTGTFKSAPSEECADSSARKRCIRANQCNKPLTPSRVCEVLLFQVYKESEGLKG